MFNQEKHVKPYNSTRSIKTAHGYVVWRRGTGGNVEILHLRVYEDSLRKGHGRDLLKRMLTALRHAPPFCTIYGLSLPINESGHAFYRAMGFVLSPVVGVYAAGSAVVFSADYEA